MSAKKNEYEETRDGNSRPGHYLRSRRNNVLDHRLSPTFGDVALAHREACLPLKRVTDHTRTQRYSRRQPSLANDVLTLLRI
jgi:hypothetical protein